MNQITQRMKEHYESTFKQYGANFQGVDWGGGDDEGLKRLDLRYQKMLEVIDGVDIIPDKISVLDVGCGYGGLYEYALKQEYTLDYTGIDVCDNMIQYAADKHPECSFICKDALEYMSNQKYTFVICNGILTQKLGASILEMDEYARKLISKMWSMSDTGIVFNIMKSQVDFMNDALYYKSPLEIIAYCMTLTDKFKVDSSYPLYEYCVYLYK